VLDLRIEVFRAYRMDVEDSQSKIEIVDSLDASQTSLTSDDLTNLSTGASEVEETRAATGKVPDSEEKNSNHYEVPTSDTPPIDLEQMSSNTMETSSSDYQEEPRNKQRVHNIGDDTQLDTVLTTNEPTMDTDSISEEFKPHINNDNVDNIQSKESDFGFAEHDENDDFGEFGDFDATGDGLSNADDEFGDFGEFDEVSEVDNAEEEPQLEPDTNIEGMEDYVMSATSATSYLIWNLNQFVYAFLRSSHYETETCTMWWTFLTISLTRIFQTIHRRAHTMTQTQHFLINTNLDLCSHLHN
jgi:hypothetical protein